MLSCAASIPGRRHRLHLRRRLFLGSPQDPIYRPDYYLDLPGFRALTSQRMKKFVDQK